MLTKLGRGLSPRSSAMDLSERKVALLGDSITASHSYTAATANIFENVGWFCYANFHLYQRFGFSHALNFGVSGEQTAAMLARVGDLAAQSPDIVIVFAGTNDIANQVAPSSITSNLESIYSYIKGTLGAQVVAMTITPRSDWPAGFDAADITQAIADIKTVNSWIMSQSDIIVVDAYAAWDDGNDAPAAGYTHDGKHPAPEGAAVLGDVLAKALEPYYGKGTTPDFTAANLLSGGDMAGVGGSLPSGCQGDIPSAWDVQVLGGSADNSWRIFSKTADDKLKIEINIPQGSGDGGLILYQAASSPDTAVNYIAEAEVEVESLSSNVDALTFEIREEGGSAGHIYHGALDELSGSPAHLSGRGILRTPEINLASDATKARARLIIDGSSTSAPVTASIVVHGIRLVPV